MDLTAISSALRCIKDITEYRPRINQIPIPLIFIFPLQSKHKQNNHIYSKSPIRKSNRINFDEQRLLKLSSSNIQSPPLRGLLPVGKLNRISAQISQVVDRFVNGSHQKTSIEAPRAGRQATAGTSLTLRFV